MSRGFGGDYAIRAGQAAADRVNLSRPVRSRKHRPADMTAEIVKLQSKTAKARGRQLRNLKRAAEVLRAEHAAEPVRRAAAYVSLALDRLSDDEMSVQDLDAMMACVRVILSAVRLDIYARLSAPKLAAIEGREKTIDLSSRA